MATIENRSPWAVTVTRNPNLYREFRCSELRQAEAYAGDLRVAGHKVKLEQLENSWQVRARDRGYPTFCATFDTYEEAEKTQKQLEAKRALKVFRDFGAALKHSPAQIMGRYIDEVCPGHKGGDVEVMRLRRLIRDEDFVDKPLASLCTEDLQDYVTDRLTEVAPSTVDRELDLIRQVLRYAADVWKIEPSEDPFDGLRRPKYYNERDRRLKPSEEAALLKAARDDSNPYVAPAIEFALATAMRRGEMLSLTWYNVDFERRAALLPKTKNGRARTVPLSARAIEVLQSLPRVDERVFRISANALKIAFFRRVLPASGVSDFHFHDLRHEAISRLAESGQFTMIDLQAISGHRDVRMLLRYSHLCTQQLAEKMDDVAAIAVEKIHHGRKRRTFQEVPQTLSSRRKAATPAELVQTPRLSRPALRVIRGGAR
jgi:integrase